MNSEISPGTGTHKWKFLRRFVKCLIIAGLVTVVLIGAILYFNIYLPEGKGPAGPDVPGESFKKIWSERKVLLLGIGDSITDGFGAKPGFSYFERLVRNPEGDSEDMLGKNLSAVFPKLEIKNIAGSGSNSIFHLRQIQALEQQDPNVLGIVVITTGGNDLIHNYGQKPPEEGAMYGATLAQAKLWINNFQKRLDEMISGINIAFPGGCHIFLANIYDPSDGTGNTGQWYTGLPAWPDGLAILNNYNQIIRQCADKYDNVYMVDIYTPFLGHGIHCRKLWLKNHHWSDASYWYHINIEDPSDRGYDAIRRAFLIEMAKVFNETNAPYCCLKSQKE